MKLLKKDIALNWSTLKKVALYSLGIILSFATVLFLISTEQTVLFQLDEKLVSIGKGLLILLFAGAISIKSNTLFRKTIHYLNKKINTFSRLTLQGVILFGSLLLSVSLYQIIGNIIPINLSVIVTFIVSFILWLEIKLLPGNKVTN